MRLAKRNMQPIWNGDRRDRVKWSAIYHLSDKHGIRDIVWVAFKRDETDKILCIYETDPTLQKHDSMIPVPDRVWSHFSDLERIKELFDDGRTVHVLSEPFEHQGRKKYIDDVIACISKVRKPCLVFLDPDTGIAPLKTTVKHVAEREIREIWDSLKSLDMLLVYQHGERADKKKKWLTSCETFESACGGADVSGTRSPQIAEDVALFWATHD